LTQTPDKTDKEIETLTAQFGRAVRRSRAVLFLERAVPRVLPPLYTSGIFLSASWAGLWLPLPPAARIAGVVAFAAAFLASPLLAKTKTLLVSKDDALKRLDSNAGDPTRPAQTLGDKPSAGSPQGAKDLWNLHLSRTWDKWGGKFEAGRPNFDLATRDPYYLRFIVPVLLLLSGALAGEQRMGRLTSAFNWSADPSAATVQPSFQPLKIRAWVTPPDNIDTAPLYLTEATRDDTQGGKKLVVHEKSVLTLLLGGPNKVTVNGEDLEIKKVIMPKTPTEKPTYQYDIPMTSENTVISINGGPTWNFSVTQDQSPTVTLDTVSPNEKNIKSLDVTCAANDDYGVREGEVVMRIPGGAAPGATPLPSGKLPPIVLPAPCVRQ
jgi:hypothetical protein